MIASRIFLAARAVYLLVYSDLVTGKAHNIALSVVISAIYSLKATFLGSRVLHNTIEDTYLTVHNYILDTSSVEFCEEMGFPSQKVETLLGLL